MHTVYSFGPAWDMLDPSPFGTKLLAYLTLADIPVKTLSGFQYIRSAPKGKMPYMEMESGEMLGDSSFIIQAMKAQYGDRVSPNLTADQRAVGQAVTRMLDEGFYWNIVYARWADDHNWREFTFPTFFGKMPAWQRAIIPPMLRKGVIKSLHQQGLGRHSADEITQIGQRDLNSIAQLLGDNPFLFGDAPCEYDAWVYAFTSSVTNVPHKQPLKAVIADSPIAEYIKRFEAHTQLLSNLAGRET